MKMTYILLSLASLLFFFLYGVNYKEGNWQEAVFINLATGTVGTVITLIFVDEILRRIETQSSKKYASIATLRIRVYLQRHLNLLFNMSKAASPKEYEVEVDSLQDIFDEQYYQNIRYLDIKSTAPVSSGIRWADYIHQESQELYDQLKDLLDNYAPYIDIDVVETIEQLRASHLASFFKILPGAADHSQGPIAAFGDINMWPLTEDYVRQFLKITNYFNAHALDGRKVFFDTQLWRNDIAPQFGSGRLMIQ